MNKDITLNSQLHIHFFEKKTALKPLTTANIRISQKCMRKNSVLCRSLCILHRSMCKNKILLIKRMTNIGLRESLEQAKKIFL